MKLSTQLLLEETETIKEQALADFLLTHILVQGSLYEIWQGLGNDERGALKEGRETELLAKLQITFPLLIEFVRRNIKDQLVKKTIRFEEADNQMYYGDDPIEELTSYEFKLLQFLVKNPDRVLNRNEIIQTVWSDEKSQEGVSDEALSQMIHRLRRKIEDEADSPKHILTVKGRGIRFIP